MMTSRERMRAVMLGEKPDRTPFFPCIYIDHACFCTGHDFEETLRDPILGARSLFEAAKLYGCDVVRVRPTPPRSWFRDKEVRREGERLVQIDRRSGAIDGWFDVQGGGALIPAHRPKPPETLAEVEAIPVLTARELLEAGCFDTAREITKEAHERGLFVVGMTGAETINFLVQQLGDSQQALLKLADDREFVLKMFEKGTATSIEVGKALAEIGVDCLYIGDSWTSGSVISPRMYTDLCSPFYQRAADAARANGVFVYKHCCGNYNPLLEAVQHDHLDGMEGMDPTSGMSVTRTRAAIGDRLALIGGVSCLSLLQATPEQVYQESKACIEAGGPRFVLGSACAVPRFSTVANMRAFAQAALDTAH
jgi:uroporphyrinogen-III decarboxylase